MIPGTQVFVGLDTFISFISQLAVNIVMLLLFDWFCYSCTVASVKERMAVEMVIG